MAEEQNLNIYQKLAKIRKATEVLEKNKSGFNYKYVTEDLILSKITGLMNRMGISLIPKIVEGTTTVEPYQYSKTKTTKNGNVYEEKINEILVKCDMTWTWVNNDNPEECIIVPWSMVGQQSDASQAFGSGLTYSSRYFLLKYFNIATPDEDPDSWRTKQKEAEESEDREIAKQIVEQIHKKVNDYVSSNPDDRESLISIVKKYAKTKGGKPSSNYFDIHDPNVAGELLKEIDAKIHQSNETQETNNRKEEN